VRQGNLLHRLFFRNPAAGKTAGNRSGGRLITGRIHLGRVLFRAAGVRGVDISGNEFCKMRKKAHFGLAIFGQKM
jgi:hypothetical protein